MVLELRWGADEEECRKALGRRNGGSVQKLTLSTDTEARAETAKGAGRD